jgi:HD-GYP domain-containing protein (c-di-GMP phosphodiesterase class II)
MAIADIFEALTSSDRPYMEPRPLDQAVRIMHSMCEGGHLCPDLFALFLESDVHLRYAREHMRAEQLDAAESA